MSKTERTLLIPYHRELAEILKSEPNRELRKQFLVSERLTPEYTPRKLVIG